MKLYKWPEIENTYNTKDEAFKRASQLHNTIWVVTEKIDGTNIGLNIFKDHFVFNSRNQIRNPQDSFYNLYANVYLIQPIVDRLQKRFFKSDMIERMIVYGEYFGKKIMGRIDYKVNYAFRFFSLQIVYGDGYRYIYPFEKFQELFKEEYLDSFIVPVLKICPTFQEALEYPNDNPSTFNDKVKMEGVVIQPYNHSFDVDDKINLLFKNKNTEFVERSHKPKRIPSEFSLEEGNKLQDLNEEFKSYCNESRMYSVISKLDEPESVKDFQKIIGPFIEDAFNDFQKDHPDLELSKKERKIVTNVGSDAYQLFVKILTSKE